MTIAIDLTGDIISLFLGCQVPMLLRGRKDNAYEVIGECFIHGLMDGEGLLGPLPEDWQIKSDFTPTGHLELRYVNKSLNTFSTEDPRITALGDVPKEWEKIEAEWIQDDPANCRKYRNRSTGKVINSDPRLLPDALRARGVQLETFRLV